jgi:hypothetical protein
MSDPTEQKAPIATVRFTTLDLFIAAVITFDVVCGFAQSFNTGIGRIGAWMIAWALIGLVRVLAQDIADRKAASKGE